MTPKWLAMVGMEEMETTIELRVEGREITRRTKLYLGFRVQGPEVYRLASCRAQGSGYKDLWSNIFL